MKRMAWFIGAGVAVVAGTVLVLSLGRGKEEIRWKTTKVEKGRITQRINATGTLNALIQVPVGTQVSGVVNALYADYNSLVKKGQVIAQIDPTLLEAQLKDAMATLDRAQATYDNARTEFERTKRLASQALVSKQDLDAKDTTLKTALAGLQSARAALTRAKVNLGYCTITAPVDGVVVSRMVDTGQTVAASFSTPNLFTIAQDLSKMKVEASIDEADIGQVKPGQRAFFTVDSYPDRQFMGQVSEVRLEPVVNQNVVTYKVVMEVANEPKDASQAPQGAGPEAGPGKGGRPEGGRPAAGAGAPDPEAAWQRMKDHLPPGTTKEQFMQRFRERLAKGGGEHGGQRGAKPGEKGAASGLAGIAAPSTARYIPAGSLVYRGDLALLPGMTANVSIVTNRREECLRVPSVALRFNPMAFMKDEKAEKGKKEGGNGQGAPQQGQGQNAQQRGGGLQAKGMVARREDRVWILENGKPKAIPVKVGITDGQFTEISGEGLSEGMAILTGVEDNKKAATAAPIMGGPRH